MAHARLRSAFWALALLLAPAWGASATTVSFVWTGASSAGPVAGLGTSSVSVSGTDPATLTLEIQVNVDARGLQAISADLVFDTGPGFDDELNLIDAAEIPYSSPKATLPLLRPGLARSQESSGAVEGQVFGLEVFSFGNGPRNVTLTFARILFATKPPHVASDGDDVFTSADRDPLVTAFIDNPRAVHVFSLQARVNLIPEPASAALLGLGLTALAAAARGERRSPSG